MLSFDATNTQRSEKNASSCSRPMPSRTARPDRRGISNSQAWREAIEAGLDEANIGARIIRGRTSRNSFLYFSSEQISSFPERDIVIQEDQGRCVWPERRVSSRLDGHATHQLAHTSELDRAHDRRLEAKKAQHMIRMPHHSSWSRSRSSSRRLLQRLFLLHGVADHIHSRTPIPGPAGFSVGSVQTPAAASKQLGWLRRLRRDSIDGNAVLRLVVVLDVDLHAAVLRRGAGAPGVPCLIEARLPITSMHVTGPSTWNSPT